MSNLTVLSENEVQLIHENSIKILGETGVVVESEKVLQVLADAGCNVDFPSMRVKFAPEIIKKALKSVPARFTLHDRNGKPAFTLGDGTVRCASGHNAVFTLVHGDPQRKESTLEDVEEFTVVSDHLDDIDIVGVPTTPCDVTPQTVLLYSVKALFENTAKPILFSSESEYVNLAVIEMSKAVLGKDSLKGCCNMICQLSPTSPLYWEKGAVEALYAVAKEGVALDFIPQPITGVTGPYTLAGLLTLHNAEVLSGVVIAQAVNPGTPVIYAAAWATYDMKYTNVLLGRPESSILRVAGAQMAHHYKMPSHSIAPDSDSNTHDEQNAWEKMLSTVAAIAGGNDLLVNCGMFATGMTISLEQLVVDSDICRIARRFSRGIEVNSDTIAYDVITNVGPRGIYITEDHTVEHLRSGEHIEPEVTGNTNYELWKSAGSKDIMRMAAEKACKILAKGNKAPLGPAVKQKLSDIIAKYEKIMGLIL